jgi:hypothetical protein
MAEVAKTSKLAPSQRMYNFLTATRQYMQESPAIQFVENNTRSATLPNTRFLSRIYLRVKGTFKAAHASKTTFTLTPFAQYKLLRQIRLTVNNSFSNFQASGTEVFLYNVTNLYANSGGNNDVNTIGNQCSASGTTNYVLYTLELPQTLSDKDLIGLINLQDITTNFSINLDCGAMSEIMTDTDVTISDVNISITPVVESFSIPLSDDFVPDYSIIKMVNTAMYPIDNLKKVVQLPTNITYRKMLFYFASDNKYTPIDHDNIDYMRLIFNQADSPIVLSADHIKYLNHKLYGGQLPNGAYCLDFSQQGIANLGGSRDYIDTQRLTECWVEVNFKNLTGTTNTMYVVAEKIAQMA